MKVTKEISNTDDDPEDDKNGFVVQLVERPTVYGEVARSYLVEPAKLK